MVGPVISIIVGPETFVHAHTTRYISPSPALHAPLISSLHLSIVLADQPAVDEDMFGDDETPATGEVPSGVPCAIATSAAPQASPAAPDGLGNLSASASAPLAARVSAPATPSQPDITSEDAVPTTHGGDASSSDGSAAAAAALPAAEDGGGLPVDLLEGYSPVDEWGKMLYNSDLGCVRD